MNVHIVKLESLKMMLHINIYPISSIEKMCLKSVLKILKVSGASQAVGQIVPDVRCS